MESMEQHSNIEKLSDPKIQKLIELLRSFGRVAVAYSGGVDSAFLLKAAWDVLGENAVGVLAYSESLDQNEFHAAKLVAAQLGIPIRIIETREYDNPEYRKNNPDRCYWCKSELFKQVIDVAEAEGIPFVLDGSNFDDLGDYRPGTIARNEKGVRSPLQEIGLRKEEIRRYSQALGVPTWNKPAAPCLSSRIPYGSEVTDSKLRQVEAGESALRSLGFREVRVRHHGPIARIEIPPSEFERLLEKKLRQDVVSKIKEVGFLYVTLDIQGLRSGSLNEGLRNEGLRPEAPPSGVPLVDPDGIRLI